MQPDKEILVGILDDGCAFANTCFQSASMETRVLWLWNQDKNAGGFPLDKISGPSGFCNFGYGGQWSAPDLNEMLVEELDGQSAVYVRARLPGLRRSAAHGPHVMDLLCGNRVVSDPISESDIVFIQFPLRGIDDPSGRWLARYAMDGLHYIIECAGQDTDTIVVNLSWGPQTGPHDGTSVLERAIDDLVDEQYSLGRRLIISLPAGNSHGSRAHAEVDYRSGGRLHWVVPPDGHTPAFFEVWWPAGVSPADARLRVAPPGGAAVDIEPGKPWNELKWYARLKSVGASTMALIVAHPTEYRDAQRRGEHGLWTIEFKPGQADVDGQIHTYVARADHNMGARRRAKANYLSDTALEDARFASPSTRFADVVGSTIRRAGTLNGIATGDYSIVAAGYRHSDSAAAPYSSSGPTRGTRSGPDFAFVTDTSSTIPGIRATGVRSGTKIRLVGTSMASPQLARQLVNGLRSKVPVPDPPNAAQRFGGGRIQPDPGIVNKA